jgi:hypothetical protein
MNVTVLYDITELKDRHKHYISLVEPAGKNILYFKSTPLHLLSCW